MVNRKKKGTSGIAKQFITRTQAVRKLQISLQDFRRLCIFKGIYPREPSNRKKASKSSTPSTTFYYAKDIQYLLHEPLINKFRDHKALAKKIGRALGRGEVGDAARLERNKSRTTLDHIIKERYPTFVDALRDLDDALSMLFLFANLPSTAYVSPKTIALCQRLCLEFEHYLIVTHSLRKSFLSIKGIYYQATIQGQDILWLVPYRFVQKMQGDIDFRIMSTFVEFYTTLLGFVNYRLYTSIGLVYPPKFSAQSDNQGGELGAFQIEGRKVATEAPSEEKSMNGAFNPPITDSTAQQVADDLGARPPSQAEDAYNDSESVKAHEEDPPTEALDKFELAAPSGADVLLQPEASEKIAAKLFEPFTIFLSRETPRAPLEFILKAFGCKRVGWDPVLGDGAFTTDENDSSITHQIVDRPNLPPNKMHATVSGEDDANNEEARSPSSRPRIAGRIYVQPQWVWDCVNQGKLLRPDLFAPGATLPPHLSPWVKPKKGAYDPTTRLEEQEGEDEAQLHAEELDAEEGTEEGEETFEISSESENAEEEHSVELSGVESESRQAESAVDWDGFSENGEDMSDAEAEALGHQRELEAEALGLPLNGSNGSRTDGKLSSEIRRKVEKRRNEQQEELERRRMMLPSKKRRLFDAMAFGNKKREVEAEKLRKKRRKLERSTTEAV